MSTVLRSKKKVESGDREGSVKEEKEMITYHGTNAVGGCWSKCVVVGVCSINSSVTAKKIKLKINGKNVITRYYIY